MKKKAARFIQNSTLMLASIIVVLLLFEGYLRLTGYFPAVSVPAGLFTNHPRTGVTLRPNFSGISGFRKDVAEKVTYTINSQGIRAPYDFSQKAEKVSQRIFMIGDSFAFGSNVNEEDTYSRLLQNRLQAHGRSVEVVNLGVPGFGTEQAFERMREYADLLGVPDIVMYMFCPNDPLDNIAGKKEVVNGIRMDSDLRAKLLLSLVGHAYYRSRLLALFLDHLYLARFHPHHGKKPESPRRSDGKNSFNGAESMQVSDIRQQEDFRSTVASLNRMIAWARKNQVHFFVMTTSPSRYARPLKEFLEKRDVILLEAREVFSRRNAEPSALVLADGHWNKRGHALVAQGIEKLLLRQAWIARSGAQNTGREGPL